MTSKTLSKHYDCLTPEERLPLIYAAKARGDDLESERLARSAPRLHFSEPDYLRRSQAIFETFLWNMIDLLDAATTFWRASHVAESASVERDATIIDRCEDLASVAGYTFTVHLEGWRAFCREQRIDAEAILRMMPAHRHIKDTEPAARLLAFTKEQAEAFMKAKGGIEGSMKTAETVKADLQDYLDTRMDL